MLINTRAFLICISAVMFSIAGCGGSSSSSNESTTEDNDTEPSTISISGSVAAGRDDVDAVATRGEVLQKIFVELSPIRLVFAATVTGAAANESLAGATVSLYKIFSGSTAEQQVDIGEVTSDANGDFEIVDVAPAPAGDGSSTDFYYEIRITKGELELKSPAAPDDDATVNVTPETDLAAKILSEVVDVPGVDNPPLPSAKTTEALREMVMQNAGDLVDEGAIDIPDAIGAGGQDIIIATANGLASAGGNAEKMFKAASFEAEYLALSTNNASSDADATAYLKRVTKESCGDTDDVLPQALADHLGSLFNDSETVTPSQVVTAYNSQSTGPDLVLLDAINRFKTLLTDVENNYGASANAVTEFADYLQVALYTKRQLAAESFDENTALNVDQAILFFHALEGDNNSLCAGSLQISSFDLFSDLFDEPTIGVASIANVEIYHNSGFGCNEGSGEGHFYAEVSIHSAEETVSTVIISSSDSSALGGDGTETLSLDGGVYKSNTNGICVSLASNVTYTVTASFDGGSSATATVERLHPRIPEAASDILIGEVFVAGSAGSDSPSVVDTLRPLYQWTSPAEMLTNIINDSSNSSVKSALDASSAQVKYTYEFSHVDTTDEPVSPAGACAMVSSGALYSVDSFIPTEDCDVTACAASLGVDAADVACRINIQSYYVDESDNVLGQAAGHFRFFCVDTDGDGSCG